MANTAVVGELSKPESSSPFKTSKGALDNEFKGYVLLALLVACGYLWSDSELISPEYGVGYWLGIIGGVLMLTLLLYPVRKKLRLLGVLGSTRAWFQMHMLFGLLGPLMILYHCNFQLGSLNSRVALYSTLLVAGSGIIGRFLYSTIHRGLSGKKISFSELQADLAQSVEQNRGLAALTPHLVTRLNKLSAEMRGCEVTDSLGIRKSLRWTVSHRFVQVSLLLTARKELRMAAQKNDAVARDYDRLLRTIFRYVRDYTRLIGRVAQFSFYERLFSFWHVFHLPIFYLLVVSALFHVLAVHMY
ncbi:MAG: transcriptional regulator [Gammaproteobacteria bacterium]|nr:transcriptional regulator [Gammaproteobacteria bacterium]